MTQLSEKSQTGHRYWRDRTTAVQYAEYETFGEYAKANPPRPVLVGFATKEMVSSIEDVIGYDPRNHTGKQVWNAIR